MDSDRLANNPQTTKAIEKNFYVILELVDCPKDYIHTRRLGPYTILINRTIMFY